MMTLGSIWRATDLVAARQDLSVSAGAADRSRPHDFANGAATSWPYTESLSRVLQATNPDMSDFTSLLHSDNERLHCRVCPSSAWRRQGEPASSMMLAIR